MAGKSAMENMEINYWKDKSVFVTGATGFLGSWLVRDLAEAGACVVVIERDYEPHSNFYSFGLDKKVKKKQDCQDLDGLA